MSINRITDIDTLKGYPNGYQLNARVYDLILDGSVDAPQAYPRYTASKSISTAFNVAAGTNYVIPAAEYEDFIGSYDSGDFIVNTNGSWNLSPGVYEILVTLNLATTNSVNECTVELIDYFSGVIFASVPVLASNVNTSHSLNYMLGVSANTPVAVRLTVSNASAESVTIQGADRSSFFSIKRLF